jgi:glycerol-3-phosphate dehydrogenase
VGAIFYDVFAGKNGLSSSYFMSKEKAIESFPTLKSDNLKGAIVYYDGMNCVHFIAVFVL